MPDNPEPLSQRRFWTALQKIGTIIAPIAVTLAAVGFYLQYRNRNPILDVTTEDIEHITRERIRNFQATYRLGDRIVNDLWRVKISIKNSGIATVFGQGPHRNILNEYIPFSVGDGFDLIDVETGINAPKISVAAVSKREFSLAFNQWRKGEAVVLTTYLERRDSTLGKPIFFCADRFIADGDIVFLDATTKEPHKARPLIDYLPSIVAVPVRLFFAIACLMLLGVMFYAFNENLRKIRKNLRYRAACEEWTKAFGKEAKKYVCEKMEADEALRNLHGLNIQYGGWEEVGPLGTAFWKDFRGRQPPDEYPFRPVKSVYEIGGFVAFFFGVLWIVVGLALAVLT